MRLLGEEVRGIVDAQRAANAGGDVTPRRNSAFEAEAKYVALVAQIPGVVYLDPVDEASQ